jgi:hypothetical protein
MAPQIPASQQLPQRKKHMKRYPNLIHRAVRQMCKANERGDLNAALRWVIIVERQLDIIDRLLAVKPCDHRVWRFRDLILAARAEAIAHDASDAEA